jgi:hypothetical protein
VLLSLQPDRRYRLAVARLVETAALAVARRDQAALTSWLFDRGLDMPVTAVSAESSRANSASSSACSRISRTFRLRPTPSRKTEDRLVDQVLPEPMRQSWH